MSIAYKKTWIPEEKNSTKATNLPNQICKAIKALINKHVKYVEIHKKYNILRRSTICCTVGT